MVKSNAFKYILLGLIVAVFLCFVMGGVAFRRDIALVKQGQYFGQPEVRRPVPTEHARRYPLQNAPQPLPPTDPKPSASAWQSPPVELLGRYQGGGATSTGFFTVGIEIRTNPRNPEQLLGYMTMINIAVPTPILGKRQLSVSEIINQRMPHQLTLMGTTLDDGSVAFHVEKNIGAMSDCPITDVRIGSFGTDGITAEWKSLPTCTGGSLVLRKQ